jgi:dUTP pyrophosphatase
MKILGSTYETSGEFQSRVHPVQVWRAHADAKLPYKATLDSAGYDLYSIDEGTLYWGETKTFSTGLIMRPPPGYHIRVYGRSGWGRKFGIGIPHGLGIVDRDYCGPNDIVQVVLRRCSASNIQPDAKGPLVIHKGDRIAQMTIEKTNDIEFDIIEHPPAATSRGGFGSSGYK